MNNSADGKILSFSIGICAYNEREGVSILLRRLCAEKYKHMLKEIIVVSTCSHDGTNEVVESFEDKGPVNLFTESKRKGKYTCVNTIVQTAKSNGSDILVLIPADVVPYPDAIDQMLDHFKDPNIGCVSGHPIPQNTAGLTEHMGELVWEMHHETFLSRSKDELVHASGEFMSFRPELVKDLTPDTVNDDTTIANDVRRAGKKIFYEPEARVAIWVPRFIRDWWIQRLRIVSGHFTLRRKGLQTQEVSTMPIGSQLEIIFNVIRRRRDLTPFIPLVIAFEVLIRLRARFETQASAWTIVSSAKPILHK